ncbi:major facilitator superfamily protein [Arthrobacter sp. Hiyo8]|nr:major facilitator superfamily protein [Arthrobacter sp. Hiyo8]
MAAGVAIAGWLFAGAGMGLMYPRLSVMTLALSKPEDQGFNSSAMSISDSLGGALSLAVTGLVFSALTTTAGSFAGVFVLTSAIAVVGLVIAPRVAARRPSGAEHAVDAEAHRAAEADDVRA